MLYGFANIVIRMHWIMFRMDVESVCVVTALASVAMLLLRLCPLFEFSNDWPWYITLLPIMVVLGLISLMFVGVSIKVLWEYWTESDE